MEKIENFMANHKVLTGIAFALIFALFLSGLGDAMDHDSAPRIYTEQDLSE
jgi:hypothetical protein